MEAEGFDFNSVKSKQQFSRLRLSAPSDIKRSSRSPETNREKKMVLQGTLAPSVQRPTWNLSSPQMCVMGRQREGDRKEGKITEQE